MSGKGDSALRRGAFCEELKEQFVVSPWRDRVVKPETSIELIRRWIRAYVMGRFSEFDRPRLRVVRKIDENLVRIERAIKRRILLIWGANLWHRLVLGPVLLPYFCHHVKSPRLLGIQPNWGKKVRHARNAGMLSTEQLCITWLARPLYKHVIAYGRIGLFELTEEWLMNSWALEPLRVRFGSSICIDLLRNLLNPGWRKEKTLPRGHRDSHSCLFGPSGLMDQMTVTIAILGNISWNLCSILYIAYVYVC